MIKHETSINCYTPDEKNIVANILDTRVAPFMGSIFLTALNEYPQFKLLQSVQIKFANDFDRFVGGVNPEGKSMVVLGLNHDIVTPGLKSRIIKRFDLPSNFENAPTNIFKLFILAHELGHVIQADPKFSEVFGEIDHTVYQPEEGYARYVESDHEANADYIAATIIAKSEVGKSANYSPPDKPPMQWKDWAREHPVIN